MYWARGSERRRKAYQGCDFGGCFISRNKITVFGKCQNSSRQIAKVPDEGSSICGRLHPSGSDYPNGTIINGFIYSLRGQDLTQSLQFVDERKCCAILKTICICTYLYRMLCCVQIGNPIKFISQAIQSLLDGCYRDSVHNSCPWYAGWASVLQSLVSRGRDSRHDILDDHIAFN